MGRRWTGDRVDGPYYQKGWGWYGIWRIGGPVRKDGRGGRRQRARLDVPDKDDELTKALAELAVEAAQDELDCPGEQTVTQAVDRYASKLGRESGPRYEEWTRGALAPLVKAAGGIPTGRLTAKHAAACLEGHEPRAMATRKSYWKALVRFSAHLVKRGACLRDFAADHLRRRERLDEPLPWKTKRGARLINRGKPQLRNLAEVEAYIAAALAYDHATTVPKEAWADSGRQGRVASLLPLLCNLSSGEVLHLRVADIDFGAVIIHVRDLDDDTDPDETWNVKTASRKRRARLPVVLEADLRALVAGKDADAYLLQGEKGRPHTRWWLQDLVRTVCERGRVDDRPIRVVCPHGLRGTHSTVLQELMGMDLEDIAQRMGHGDRGGVARRHYVGASKVMPELRVVVGGKAKEKADD